MSFTKRELEVALVNANTNMETVAEACGILNKAIVRIMDEGKRNGAKTLISDLAYVAHVESGIHIGQEYSSEVMSELVLAKKRIEDNRY